jgi:hypothetical protein
MLPLQNSSWRRFLQVKSIMKMLTTLFPRFYICHFTTSKLLHFNFKTVTGIIKRSTESNKGLTLRSSFLRTRQTTRKIVYNFTPFSFFLFSLVPSSCFCFIFSLYVSFCCDLKIVGPSQRKRTSLKGLMFMSLPYPLLILLSEH